MLVTVLSFATWLMVLTPAVALEEGPPGDAFGVVDTTTAQWYLRNKGYPLYGYEWTYKFMFGLPGEVPMLGDWDCDGLDTPGMFRPTDGYAYMRNNIAIGYGDVGFFLGQSGDVPIAGDFDGDGCDTVSLYRPSEGRVFVFNSLGSNDLGLGSADYSYYYGNPLDKPFSGDFDGDGIDTVGLHRESTGQVFLRNTNTRGAADIAFYYGNPGDRVVAGDWAEKQEHGSDTVGVFRPYARTMHLRATNTPGAADWSFLYGNPKTVPVSGHFEQGGGSVNYRPALEAEMTLKLSASEASGECEVVVSWGDWRGPLYASIALRDQINRTRSSTAGFSSIITSTGNEHDYRHVFGVGPSTYSAYATIYTGDIASGQAVHYIGDATPGSNIDCG
jgi:hypothetical protein